jgi:hypothetical protein
VGDLIVNVAAMITLGIFLGAIIGPFIIAFWAVFKNM